jgi:acylpyruvate hydrolase
MPAASAASAAATAASPRFARLGGKLVCVAKNYAAHALEMGGSAARPAAPSIFLKPHSSVIRGGDGRAVVRPRAVRELHHEVELGVVVGRAVPRGSLRAADWRGAVGGYVLALDMTARDHQAAAKAAGAPWTLGKCWDSFAPLSARVLAPSAVRDPHALELSLSVDGAERQRASTAGMLFRVPELLAHAASVMSLERGDVLLTGTPEGVGPVRGGNVMRAALRDLSGGGAGVLLDEMEFRVEDEAEEAAA